MHDGGQVSSHLFLVTEKQIISEALASSAGVTLTFRCLGKPREEPCHPGISVAQPRRVRHACPARDGGPAVAG